MCYIIQISIYFVREEGHNQSERRLTSRRIPACPTQEVSSFYSFKVQTENVKRMIGESKHHERGGSTVIRRRQ